MRTTPRAKALEGTTRFTFLAPRFYELVVISITTTLPAIHVESYRLQALVRSLVVCCRDRPRPGVSRQAHARRKILNATETTNQFFVFG